MKCIMYGAMAFWVFALGGLDFLHSFMKVKRKIRRSKIKAWRKLVVCGRSVDALDFGEESFDICVCYYDWMFVWAGGGRVVMCVLECHKNRRTTDYFFPLPRLYNSWKLSFIILLPYVFVKMSRVVKILTSWKPETHSACSLPWPLPLSYF